VVEALRCFFVPKRLRALHKLRSAVHFPARADQAVAGEKLVAQPWHPCWAREATLAWFALAIDRVEPQRHFGELDCNRVQVRAEYVAIRKVHANLLQLARIVFVRNARPSSACLRSR